MVRHPALSCIFPPFTSTHISFILQTNPPQGSDYSARSQEGQGEGKREREGKNRGGVGLQLDDVIM